jgi:hypothetical protein
VGIPTKEEEEDGAECFILLTGYNRIIHRQALASKFTLW